MRFDEAQSKRETHQNEGCEHPDYDKDVGVSMGDYFCTRCGKVLNAGECAEIDRRIGDQ